MTCGPIARGLSTCALEHPAGQLKANEALEKGKQLRQSGPQLSGDGLATISTVTIAWGIRGEAIPQIVDTRQLYRRSEPSNVRRKPTITDDYSERDNPYNTCDSVDANALPLWQSREQPDRQCLPALEKRRDGVSARRLRPLHPLDHLPAPTSDRCWRAFPQLPCPWRGTTGLAVRCDKFCALATRCNSIAVVIAFGPMLQVDGLRNHAIGSVACCHSGVQMGKERRQRLCTRDYHVENDTEKRDGYTRDY